MDYHVRSATAHDIAAIIRLERESPTAAHWTDQQYESLFAKNPSVPVRLVLLASPKEQTTILGFLVARNVSREWELENIVVGGEHRGRGIGTSLLAELLSRARRNDGETVSLEVRESNLAARALYRKYGFEEIGRRKGYYSNPPDDAILYSKTIENVPTAG